MKTTSIEIRGSITPRQESFMDSVFVSHDPYNPFLGKGIDPERMLYMYGEVRKPHLQFLKESCARAIKLCRRDATITLTHHTDYESGLVYMFCNKGMAVRSFDKDGINHPMSSILKPQYDNWQDVHRYASQGFKRRSWKRYPRIETDAA